MVMQSLSTHIHSIICWQFSFNNAGSVSWHITENTSPICMSKPYPLIQVATFSIRWNRKGVKTPGSLSYQFFHVKGVNSSHIRHQLFQQYAITARSFNQKGAWVNGSDCMAQGHWDAYDSCGFRSFDCRDLSIWTTNQYLPEESLHNNANLARIRYDDSSTLTEFENQRQRTWCYFRLEVSKVPLYT